MRYRALTSSGDMTFGQGQGNFLINSPAAVAQLIMTRLKLWEGEWFLDLTEGMPWLQRVLGTNTQSTYDQAIRLRVLQTQGVTEITKYSSSRSNAPPRLLTVSMDVNTQFGVAPGLLIPVSLSPFLLGGSSLGGMDVI